MIQATQLSEALRWLERSRLAEVVRVAPFLYPLLESLHVLGIALLVGSAILVDLRLLGIGRHALPVTTVARYLLPVSRVGFVLVALTGFAMFSGIARAVAGSAAAPWKLGLIAVAGINVLVFHFGIYRSVHRWDLNSATPVSARVAAIVSAFCWAGTIIAGRFLAY
jgi:hypothetical protein